MTTPTDASAADASASKTAAPPSVAAVVQPAVVQPAVGPVPVIHRGERPEKFNGQNFKRWQQKILFYLTTLNLVRFLTEAALTTPEGVERDSFTYTVIEAWSHSDYLCRNYILNSLHDSLYEVYSVFKTAKDLWKSLDKKYKTEDGGSKKFLVVRFLDFKMVDSKTFVKQVEELYILFHEIAAEGMSINEAFLVAAVIEKLPEGWKDFKNYLKHKKKEMSLEDLITRLRIEEGNRGSARAVDTSAKANLAEYKGPKAKKQKNEQKLGPKGGIAKKKIPRALLQLRQV